MHFPVVQFQDISDPFTITLEAPKYRQNLAALLLQTPAHQKQSIIATPVPTPKPTPKPDKEIASPGTSNISYSLCEGKQRSHPQLKNKLNHESVVKEILEQSHWIPGNQYESEVTHNSSDSRPEVIRNSKNSPSTCSKMDSVERAGVRAEQNSFNHTGVALPTQGLRNETQEQVHESVHAPLQSNIAPLPTALCLEPSLLEYEDSKPDSVLQPVKAVDSDAKCPLNDTNESGKHLPFVDTAKDTDNESERNGLVKCLLEDIVSCVVMLVSCDLVAQTIPNSVDSFLQRSNNDNVTGTSCLGAAEHFDRESDTLNEDLSLTETIVSQNKTPICNPVDNTTTCDCHNISSTTVDVQCGPDERSQVNQSTETDPQLCEDHTNSAHPIIKRADVASECLVLKQSTVSQFVQTKVQEKENSSQTKTTEYISTAAECLILKEAVKPSLVDSSNSPIIFKEEVMMVDCASSPIVIPSTSSKSSPVTAFPKVTEATDLAISGKLIDADTMISQDVNIVENVHKPMLIYSTQINEGESKLFLPKPLKVLAQTVIDLLNTKSCDDPMVASGVDLVKGPFDDGDINVHASQSMCLHEDHCIDIGCSRDKQLSEIPIKPFNQVNITRDNPDLDMDNKLEDSFYYGQADIVPTEIKPEELPVSQQCSDKMAAPESNPCMGLGSADPSSGHGLQSDVIAGDDNDVHTEANNADVEQVVPDFGIRTCMESTQVDGDAPGDISTDLAHVEEASEGPLTDQHHGGSSSETMPGKSTSDTDLCAGSEDDAATRTQLNNSPSGDCTTLGYKPSELVLPDNGQISCTSLTPGLIQIHDIDAEDIPNCKDNFKESESNTRIHEMDCISESSEYDTAESQTDIQSDIISNWHINGLVQDDSNSSALAMELLQSCTKPSI